MAYLETVNDSQKPDNNLLWLKRMRALNFLQFDLGSRQRGEIVEVTLTSGSNVRLMTSSEFSNYRNGRRHQFIGGLAKQSPIRLQIPSSGHWYVAVNMQGLRGSTRASVRLDQLAFLLEEQDANELGLNVVWVEDFSSVAQLLKKIGDTNA